MANPYPLYDPDGVEVKAALIEAHGVPKVAAGLLGIKPGTMRSYMQKNPKLYELARECFVDIREEALYNVFRQIHLETQEGRTPYYSMKFLQLIRSDAKNLGIEFDHEEKSAVYLPPQTIENIKNLLNGSSKNDKE